MSLRTLPPVGEPIVLRSPAPPMTFPGFQPVWTGSGTAALALAIRQAAAQRSGITTPQVLIPAYGCPDLVAAAEYAGVQPVLVDVGSDDPGYDMGQLDAAWGPDTVAVVGVNFLGLRERMDELAAFAAGRGGWLIEDSAQAFPAPAQLSEPAGLSPAHAVVFSFGRGKPVSLLGGGCLLVNERLVGTLEARGLEQSHHSRGTRYRAKVLVYNALLNPTLYGLVSRLPMLRLGETRYHALERITGMPETPLRYLKANAERYWSLNRQAETALAATLAPHREHVTDLPARCPGRAGRLLRYPVLVRDQYAHGRLLDEGRRAGLGITSMYGQVLPDIPEVAPRVRCAGALDGAHAFARALITLPVHSGVDQRDIRNIRECFDRVFGEG